MQRRQALKPNTNRKTLPEIFKIVHHNYDILKSYGLQQLGQDQTLVIPAKELKSKGFNFKYYTSFRIDLWKKVRLYCFGMGWAKLNDDAVELDFSPEQL